MTKSITYNDLEDAAPYIEVHGVMFHTGDAVEVDDAVADKLRGSRFFDVPPADDENADGAANAKAGIASLRKEAESRGIDHEGMSKSQVREAIQNFDSSKFENDKAQTAIDADKARLEAEREDLARRLAPKDKVADRANADTSKDTFNRSPMTQQNDTINRPAASAMPQNDYNNRNGSDGKVG